MEIFKEVIIIPILSSIVGFILNLFTDNWKKIISKSILKSLLYVIIIFFIISYYNDFNFLLFEYKDAYQFIFIFFTLFTIFSIEEYLFFLYNLNKLVIKPILVSMNYKIKKESRYYNRNFELFFDNIYSLFFDNRYILVLIFIYNLPYSDLFNYILKNFFQIFILTLISLIVFLYKKYIINI